ncbi:phosphomannose isomerase [Trifolium pratense]|uniref:Phosphomannose isomerase n=1 Tax=Trifolium pratense TaxID=57577 RepID=A0A2K3N789_TRIPR|nr:phosphomannose isomerase [Trifolium pratense]
MANILRGDEAGDYADDSTGFPTVTLCFYVAAAAASMDRSNADAGVAKKRARKSVTASGTSNINQINHIPDFMHSYVESITDVKSDGNCGYRVIALDHSNNEDDYHFIKKSMLDELQLHKHSYLKMYGSGKRFAYITDALLPPKRKSRRHGVALIEKWLTLPDMGHIVATILGKVVVKLSKQGTSETFFPLRGVPSSDPSSLIICLGAIPGHYVYVKLKDGCPVPPTSIQWKQHCSAEAIVWESYFVDRQAKFTRLMKEHMVNIKKDARLGSNSCDPIEL